MTKGFFFSLYNNLNYTPNADYISKSVSKLCYNGLSCNLKVPDFFKRSLFIDIIPAKFNKITHR